MKMLGDLCKLQAGGAFPQSEQGAQRGEYPFAKVRDLSSSSGSSWYGIQNWVSEDQRIAMGARIVPRNAIVFAKIGEGLRRERLAVAPRAMLIDNNLMAAIPKDALVDPSWMYYKFRTLGISKYAVGSALPFLKQSDLNMVMVDVPVRSVQNGVVDVLRAFDDKIAANRFVASSARELSENVVAELSGFAKLADLVNLVRNSIDPASLDVKSVKHFSLPAFDAGAAKDDATGSIKSVKNLLTEPVVLVSKLNPRIPRIWAVDRLPTELALASSEFVALAPREVSIGSVWAALLDPRFTQSVLERTAGTTGSHQRVKPEQMLDVEVRDVRELATEKRVLVESLCRKVNDIADENQRLAATRDDLLPLLMSGKITVKDAEKTVEEVV